MIRSRTVNTIHELATQGKSIQDIAITLGLARNTVRKYLRHPELATMPRPRPNRRSKLDPFKEQVKGWTLVGPLLQLRGHVASPAGHGLQREPERAQSLCPSLAPKEPGASARDPLRNQARRASPIRLGRVRLREGWGSSQALWVYRRPVLLASALCSVCQTL